MSDPIIEPVVISRTDADVVVGLLKGSIYPDRHRLAQRIEEAVIHADLAPQAEASQLAALSHVDKDVLNRVAGDARFAAVVAQYVRNRCTIGVLIAAVLHTAAKATARKVDDESLRQLWRDAGGEFHGPIIETGYMHEAKLLPFLRSLVAS